MKYTCLILLLPFLLNCSSNTTNQEQSNRIKELENRIQKLESINSITEEGSLAHIIQEFGDINITQEGEFFIYDGDKYIWNGNEYEWVYDYEGKTKKSERSSTVLEEEKSKDEEELSSDSKYPNIENSNISSKCSWCNDDVSMIESFRNDGHNIYRLMDEGSYRAGELETLEKLLGEEDEDEFNSLKMAFAWVYGGDFYCSRKCASHHDD